MNKEERDKRWSSGEGYNRYISAEFASFRKEAWKKQIGGHFAGKTGLKILDVGTGPGFFACILSEEGQNVTGIDSSEGMLRCARENAEKLQVSPHFQLMDVNELEFPDDTFDVIVTRNVTWTLEHPEKVYTEFKRILKENGILLIYDANWHLHFYDEEKMKRVKEREQRYFEKYGRKEVVSGGDLEYFATAPLTRIKRPDWDQRVLQHLGMNVTITEDIGRFVYEEWEKDLYGESPLFEICAIKKPMQKTVDNMHNYWQKRADNFGFPTEMEKIREIQDRVKRYFPERKLKILDVGTGTGIIASAMALLDHEVTAVDLCSNMIRKAQENASRLGIHVNYMCTSAGELPFEDNLFDVVISRNVTWALPEPEKTIQQWQRILKPGGLLVYMDANHYYYLFNEEDNKNRETITEMAGSPHLGDKDRTKVDYSLCDETAKDMPLSQYNRPGEWDEKVLPRMGFDLVAEEIERPQLLLKYGIAKGYYTNFMIVAVNGKKDK